MGWKVYKNNTYKATVSALELITNPKDLGSISSSSFLTAHIED